jgi:hypothetical protein
MAKEVFEQSLDEILEFDRGLDINSVLESIPAIDTEEKKKTPEEEKETKEDKVLSLENINKVLEKQIEETKKDETKVEPETKEEPKKDDKAPASLEQSTDDTSDAPFTVIFARDLVKQGLLSSFDEEKFTKDTKELGDAEALRSLIKTEIDANITAAKSDLDLGYQEYLDLIGKGVPVETAGSLVELKNRFEAIKVDELIKEESTDLRKQVLTDYFKLTTSMSDKKIEKAVQNSIDLGDDIEDSKEYLTTLKGLVSDQLKSESDAADRQQKLVEEENRRSLEKLKDDINALDEIIPGVNINKPTKVQMFESITKPVQDGKGRTTNAIWAKRAEDPIFFDQRLAYLYTTGFFDKNKPWTKAVQSKATKEISDLERALDKKKNTGSGTGVPVLRNPEQDKTVKDNIDSMRGVFER